MSQENVKVVRAAWEAAERHDNEAIFPLYDADVEIQGLHGLGNRVYRGVRGVREFWRDWATAWSESGSEVEEWIDAGDDVIAVMHLWGRGKRSGVPVDARQSHVWTVRAGKLWRLRVYDTRDEALKAVGRHEGAMSQEPPTRDLVELSRLSFEPARSRNFEAMMAFWADDPVWDLSPMGLGVYRGGTAVRGFFEDWIGSYERFEVVLEECLDLGNGVVLNAIVQTASLAGSSGDVTLRYASVTVWEDSLIVSVTNYPDIDQARAAAERLVREPE